MKKRIFGLLAALSVSVAVPAIANDSVMAGQSDAKQWVMQLGNYAGTRYSELDQINKDNVGDLQVAWTFSTGVLRGHEGSPLVIEACQRVMTLGRQSGSCTACQPQPSICSGAVPV